MPMDWGLARDYAARDVWKEETRVTEAEWLVCDDPYSLLNAPRVARHAFHFATHSGDRPRREARH